MIVRSAANPTLPCACMCVCVCVCVCVYVWCVCPLPSHPTTELAQELGTRAPLKINSDGGKGYICVPGYDLVQWRSYGRLTPHPQDVALKPVTGVAVY